MRKRSSRAPKLSPELEEEIKRHYIEHPRSCRELAQIFGITTHVANKLAQTALEEYQAAQAGRK